MSNSESKESIETSNNMNNIHSLTNEELSLIGMTINKNNRNMIYEDCYTKDRRIIPDEYKMNIDNKFYKIKKIGSGAFGKICKIVNLENNSSYAVKIGNIVSIYSEYDMIKKSLIHGESQYVIKILPGSYIYKNIMIMKLPLYETDLHKIIVHKIPLNNRHILYILYSILKGLQHLRKCSIIHADLKPSNIFIIGEPNLLVSIGDLGISQLNTGNNVLERHVATRHYRAPEVIKCLPYSYEIDVWSFGCILYEVVTKEVLFKGDKCGNLSFDFSCDFSYDLNSDDTPLISIDRKNGVYNLISNFLNMINDKEKGENNFKNHKIYTTIMSNKYNTDLIELFRRCIVEEPGKRITVEEALLYPCFDEFIDD
jgi:serine/threonine protein kinase